MALLFREAGADVVLKHIVGASVSAVNLAEVAAKMVRLGSAAESPIQEVVSLGIDIIPFDAIQAAESARLLVVTQRRGLSLGDRCCLALANLNDRLVVTGDRAWAELQLSTEIRLIR